VAQRQSYASPREIADGLFWIFQCDLSPISRGTNHGYGSVYLLKGREKTLLVDAGRPARWERIAAQVEEALDGRRLDYIFPTHAEFVHAGNLGRFLDRYPGSRAVGDLRDYHLFWPGYEDRFDHKVPGDALDLGGVQAVFLKPIIYDRPDTLWVYTPQHQCLFVADGLAHEHHRPGECGQTTGEMEVLPDVDSFEIYNHRAFYWTRFTAMRPFFRDMEELLRQYPTRMIAPAHGTVITAHTAELLDMAEAGMGAGANL
jgi:flavorubredoxin